MNERKTIKKLIETLADIVSEDDKLANEYLESQGLNPKEIEESGEQFIKKMKGKLRYKIAEKRLNRLQELKGMFVFKKDKLIERSKNSIAEILSNGDKAAFQTYYRKLQDLTEKDYKEIENEQQFLDFLEELDK